MRERIEAAGHRGPFTLCACALLLYGCADQNRIYENVYEGMRTREQIVGQPQDTRPPDKTGPSYQDYEAERKKLLQPGGGAAPAATSR